MKTILLIPLLLIVEIFSYAGDTCLCPRIIEFGALDDPCHISVLTTCDTLCLYCDTSCSYAWFCDGMAIENYSKRYLNIDRSGTHEYTLVVMAASGCTDTGRITLPDRGCCTNIPEIGNSPDFKQASIVAIWDAGGKRIPFQDGRPFNSLATGIYIVEYTISNQHYRTTYQVIK